MTDLAEVPLVSVAVVTYGRHALLPLLVERYSAQRYPRKELVVLDDSDEPCQELLQLDRPDVRYHHRLPRQSVGAKRNSMLELVRGSIICQWDDDDYYAPGYLEFVAEQLRDADFVKLDRWFVLDLQDGGFHFWDTRSGAPPGLTGEQAQAWNERNRLGYGFCFGYRREVLEAVKSPDSSVGDDYMFARAVVDAGWRTALLPDQQGLVLHLVHGGNLSRCFPNRRLDPAFVGSLFPGFDLQRQREALARVAPAARAERPQ